IREISTNRVMWIKLSYINELDESKVVDNGYLSIVVRVTCGCSQLANRLERSSNKRAEVIRFTPAHLDQRLGLAANAAF
ncbi:hypothetical protein ACQHL9_23640, partial [Escherichia coli]|uniref:hypothetical protein n=1 Tax=Escherichia coli TaxID=562 RepID=UPI003CEE3EEC